MHAMPYMQQGLKRTSAFVVYVVSYLHRQFLFTISVLLWVKYSQRQGSFILYIYPVLVSSAGTRSGCVQRKDRGPTVDVRSEVGDAGGTICISKNGQP